MVKWSIKTRLLLKINTDKSLQFCSWQFFPPPFSLLNHLHVVVLKWCTSIYLLSLYMFRLIGAETWLHNFAFAEIFFHNTFFGFHFPTVLSTRVFTEPREKQSTVSDFITDVSLQKRLVLWVTQSQPPLQTDKISSVANKLTYSFVTEIWERYHDSH